MYVLSLDRDSHDLILPFASEDSSIGYYLIANNFYKAFKTHIISNWV